MNELTPPLDLVGRVYESAANAGLLKRCTWLRNPPDMPLVHHVGLRAPDDSILENLSRSKETTISYGFGVTTEIGIFTQPLPERFLRLEGLNTAQGNAKVLVELYRVAFDPLKELNLISDEYNKFELEGSLLADNTKPVDALLGQFGKIVQL